MVLSWFHLYMVWFNWIRQSWLTRVSFFYFTYASSKREELNGYANIHCFAWEKKHPFLTQDLKPRRGLMADSCRVWLKVSRNRNIPCHPPVTSTLKRALFDVWEIQKKKKYCLAYMHLHRDWVGPTTPGTVRVSS